MGVRLLKQYLDGVTPSSFLSFSAVAYRMSFIHPEDQKPVKTDPNVFLSLSHVVSSADALFYPE